MALSNTQTRIISAVVLVSIVGFLVYLGGKPLEYFITLVGFLLLDEIAYHIIKIPRFSLRYSLSTLSYLGLSYYTSAYLSIENQFILIQVLGLSLSLHLFFFLFSPEKFISIFKLLKSRSKIIPLVVVVLAAFVFKGGLSLIMQLDKGIALLSIMFFTTYATDSFAWLVGKNIGKKPLWPEVSPKKTREGALGGFIGGTVLGIILWLVLIEPKFSTVLLLIAIIPCIAQLGDLSQSRIKRWVGVKDSSNLIPGHGGIYDRVDSLMVVTPFFISILWCYYG